MLKLKTKKLIKISTSKSHWMYALNMLEKLALPHTTSLWQLVVIMNLKNSKCEDV